MPAGPSLLPFLRLREYIWRASFTDRYERAVQTATLQDYRALRDVLQESKPHETVPCFDEKSHPLPDDRAVIEAGRPRRRDTLARAVLALSLRGGAVPEMIHRGGQWTKPEKSAKALPATVGRRLFVDTGITAYRLAA